MKTGFFSLRFALDLSARQFTIQNNAKNVVSRKIIFFIFGSSARRYMQAPAHRVHLPHPEWLASWHVIEKRRPKA
jgi:hypothetical protein